MIQIACAAFLSFLLGAVQALPSAWVAWIEPGKPGSISLALPVLAVAGFALLFRLWYRAERLLPRMAIMGIAGFVYHLTALHWLGEAFVEPGQFYSTRAGLGLFGTMWLLFPWWIGGAALAHFLAIRRRPLQSALALAAGMAIAMLGLNDVIYGIPLAPAALFALDTPAVRIVTVTGQEALSALLMGLGFVVGAMRLHIALPALGTLYAALLAATTLPHPQPRPPVSDAQIALVQTGASFFWHDDPTAAANDLASLVVAGFQGGAHLVVLPENVLPFDLEDTTDPMARAFLSLPPEGRYMMVGYTRAEMIGDAARPVNKMALVGRGGIIATHTKAHLVPFGEFIPSAFRAMGFDVIAGPSGGFGRGDSLTVMAVPGLPATAVTICYELILSGAISRETDGAEWLLNPTSERLFGNTIGSRSLLDYARLRAIETGLPVLRAATTGMTAHIDAHGYVQGVIEPQIRSVVLTRLTAANPTPFRNHGQTPYLMALFSITMILLVWKGAAARSLKRNGVSNPDAVTTR